MKYLHWFVSILLFLFPFYVSELNAQRWPNDPAGDVAAERIGWMDGNAVRVQFRNTTELSDWGNGTDPYAHKWPNDFSGSKLTDGIAFMVGARVFVEDGSTPVTDPDQIQSRTDLDTLYFLQTSYREELDTDPTGQAEWAFYPPRGYSSKYFDPDLPPAMSDNSSTWPDAWPSVGDTKINRGEWFGRGGKAYPNADLECFFVVNDAQDQEYLQDDSPVKYYPRPGVLIGDRDPKMSIQWGRPWGGVGLRVSVRGYQWDNELGKDIIFWEYGIGNISDYDIPDAAVGFWVDPANGNDEVASTNERDMVYVWDVDGVGEGGFQSPAIGYVFLETPGESTDEKDNDFDGVIDEKRDNQATKIVGPYDGIDDLDHFLSFYHLNETDLREHWDADEDQDWRDGYDKNGNGTYAYQDESGYWRLEEGEWAGDDVGIDGLGPTDWDYRYRGPDEGECNHKPDYVPGIGCEPNFAELDVNESDMRGLNSFRLFPTPPHIPPYTYWFKNDASMWELIGQGEIIPYNGNINNLILTFATGPFRLKKDEEKYVSIAELHSYDDIGDFNLSPDFSSIQAPQLQRQKFTAQYVMNSDYSFKFALPSKPVAARVHTKIQDNSVKLQWGNEAEIETYEPMLDNRNDFEGYKLYKQYSIDKETDSWSQKELIFQCDKVDGITGDFIDKAFDYYLGDDTGIERQYTDKDILEGVDYKYTLVTYDYGIPADSLQIPGLRGISFPPYENFSNSWVSIPYFDPIDFPWQKISEHFIGNGSVTPEIVKYQDVKSKHTYLVTFKNDSIRAVRNAPGLKYVTNGLKVYDITKGNKELVFEDLGNRPGTIVKDYTDSLGYSCIPIGDSIRTGLFDGIRLRLKTTVMEPQPDLENTKWLSGNAPIDVIFSGEAEYFPWDLEIVFTNNPNAFVSQLSLTRSTRIYDENGVRIREGLLGEQSFPFYIRNTTFGDSLGNQAIKFELVVQDQNSNGEFDILSDRVLLGYMDSRGRWAGTVLVLDFSEIESEEELPTSGDIYQVKFKRPFWKDDSLVFIVDPEGTFIKITEKTPQRTSLATNYPNPFNSETTIEYTIANNTHVILNIYNILGQKVETLIDRIQEPGNYKLKFDGKNLSSGLYFYTLQTDTELLKKKMLLIE